MPEPTLTLTQHQYEALIALAHEGTKTDAGQVLTEKALNLEAFLKLIETENGITRDAIWIQWQEMEQPLPPTTNFPDVWPPEMRFHLTLMSRKIAKADVESVLLAHAKKPINVLITRDPGARVGFTPIDTFFLS